MEYHMRNWYYFTWLSGDFNVEQHVHNLDLCAWIMNDQYPVRAYGTGGRQARTGPDYGNIYDHHASPTNMLTAPSSSPPAARCPAA
jgi:predicted dehydrogenase